MERGENLEKLEESAIELESGAAEFHEGRNFGLNWETLVMRIIYLFI